MTATFVALGYLACCALSFPLFIRSMLLDADVTRSDVKVAMGFCILGPAFFVAAVAVYAITAAEHRPKDDTVVWRRKR